MNIGKTDDNPPATDGKEYVEPMASDEDCQWGLWTHLGPLLAAVVTTGAIAPLAIAWGLYVMHVPGKNRPFVADHGREMFNFALSYTLYWTVGTIAVGIVTFGAGLVVFMPALIVLGLVGTIQASIAGAKGRRRRKKGKRKKNKKKESRRQKKKKMKEREKRRKRKKR
eukprot:TRINITY_DN8954_c0_g1_i1.p3 TRINITY_DN8954_c0_g1~~TRINITY_DN8954_c0_g1_i1.p3  ORF type:complete len:197 (+),score=26.38 TRINITY_DN8954_c0_g1_i1:88-591(+)